MYGNLTGNILGITYFIYFQFTGILLFCVLFRHEHLAVRLLTGSVAGSLLSTWLPILFAFFLDFTLTAHLAALLVTLPLWGFVLSRRTTVSFAEATPYTTLKGHIPFLILLALFLVFWCFLLHTHTILPNKNGGISTGQCTYGDMNMHLGFITSLATQQSFPPDYSTLPGVKLSYPFLSDSISSSLLVMGASLRIAYILPMVFAMAQIFCTVYLFACSLFHSIPKALLTLLLFFCNGGFGFVYFFTRSGGEGYTFSDIFSGFYTTPTNLVEQNIRWVNVIADMFLPQRATLFGYAVLFPALFLLYRAVFDNHREYFLPSGLFLAALPMIHTHSFLSGGIISAVWMLLWLRNKVTDNSHGQHCRKSSHISILLLTGFIVLMCFLQYWNSRTPISDKFLLLHGISIFIAAVIYGVYLLYTYIRRFGPGEFLHCWGCFLFCILLFALPQLLYWTFGQVSSGGFVRGHFNWGNLGDFYPWFYIKNMGIILLAIVGSFCSGKQKNTSLLFPALFLWWIGELIVFTPNTYDNNKILYVAYLFLCFAAADYAVDLYHKLREVPGQKLFAALFLFLSSFSAILTLGREAVSDYQLYSPAQTALAAYIEENTPADSVFLTDTRHNNEISSLTGRSIVCGADTFLYFHGLDTTDRKEEVRQMYESPLENIDLFEKYNVTYAVVSPYERDSFSVDEFAYKQNFTELFSYGDTVLYLIK